MRTFPKRITGITLALACTIGLSYLHFSSRESIAHRGSGRLDDGSNTLAHRGSGRIQPDGVTLTNNVLNLRNIAHRGSGRIEFA